MARGTLLGVVHVRDIRNHLALIDHNQQLLGILTLQDLVNQLLPAAATSAGTYN
ncbi:CBS domain-containing protein [Tenggerimyces flavus]|uniref:CBS domain-containing protein n=1 Tax=Tenggerimyces flavus TaxID=1708749 RepID=A0ABV7Y3P8_9ACTN|nr:CBS domain-containing protein [Tenggerimyces flavus]MBM7790089.1 CBS domain-containing protein [Tenggerimyces flavus]